MGLVMTDKLNVSIIGPLSGDCAADAADPWISVLRTSQDFAFVRKPDVMAV